jgi:hypothetical protein
MEAAQEFLWPVQDPAEELWKANPHIGYRSELPKSSNYFPSAVDVRHVVCVDAMLGLSGVQSP